MLSIGKERRARSSQSEENTGRCSAEGDVHLSRVRASLSQKLIVPSDPSNSALYKNRSLSVPRMRRTASGERAVHGVERDVVHGVNERLVFRVGCTIAPVALEREVLSVHTISYIQFRQHDLRTDG